MTDGFTITELTIPRALDEPGGDDFRQSIEVRNRIEEYTLGNDDISPTVEAMLAAWNDEYDPKRLFLAYADGVVVARGGYSWQLEEGSTAAFLSVEVLPEYRNRGIGSALLATLEKAALDDDWRLFQGWAIHGPTRSDDLLVPPTGFGAVDRDRPEVRFLLARGYRLEQAARMSRLELPTDTSLLDPLYADALAHSSDYELVEWAGPATDELLDDLAYLHSRMSTDAPNADLEIAEEVWDAARMRANDQLIVDGGQSAISVAARHIPSGRLVAFSDIMIPAEVGRPAVQEDTLVLVEHRGHRLGMLLKIANLRQLERLFPETRRITTFNAEENRPMLRVNEAVGFTAFGYEGAWKKEPTS